MSGFTADLTWPLTADNKTFLDFILGGGSIVAPAANPFPLTDSGAPDVLNASKPSPDNSTIIIVGGKLTGAPYLIDRNGGLWFLTVQPPGIGVATVSGTQVSGGGAAQGIAQLIVRQGQVFCVLVGGQIQQWNPAQGSLYNAALPPAAASGGTAPAAPQLPPLPVYPPVVGGSSGNVIHCGAGQTLSTISAGIAAAKAGDMVLVANGIYSEALPMLAVPVLLDLGGSTLSGTGLTASLAGGGLGLVVPDASGCVVQNGTITGVGMDQTSGQMTSAVRPGPNCNISG